MSVISSSPRALARLRAYDDGVVESTCRARPAVTWAASSSIEMAGRSGRPRPPVGLRVGDPVAEDGRRPPLRGYAAGACRGRRRCCRPDQRGVLVPDEVADGEACASPFGSGCTAYCRLSRRCHHPAAEELLAVVRGGDDQHVPDTGQHQRRQWVVDHRLHRRAAIAGGHRDRVQALPEPPPRLCRA